MDLLSGSDTDPTRDKASKRKRISINLMDGYKRITEPPRLVLRNEETEASNAVSERRSSIFTSPLPFPHLHVGLGCGVPFRVNLLSSPALPRRRKCLLDKLSRVFGRGKSVLSHLLSSSLTPIFLKPHPSKIYRKRNKDALAFGFGWLIL